MHQLLVLEEEGKLAEVRFWTNQGCWSFQSTRSALSKYCKFCACTTYFGEELYRSTTSYNNLSLFVFWLWSSANQTSHGCCSAPLLTFPFTAFPKANGQMLSNNCSWNYKSDKSHQLCLKNDFNMGLVREKIERGKGMIHTLFLLFSWHPSPSGHLVRVKAGANLVPVSICIPMLAKIRVKFKKQSNFMGFFPIKKNLNSICFLPWVVIFGAPLARIN